MPHLDSLCFKAVIVLFAMGVTATLFICIKFGAARYQFPVMMLGSGGVAAIGNKLAQRARRKRSFALLTPHQGLVCPRCHYSLASSPEQGECPECGTRYTRAEVLKLWRRFCGYFPPPPNP
jgi:uncharacterized paraquat-inducible protein A